MKLFYFALSHHSRRVLAVIHKLGLPVELEHRDLTKGEHKTPEIAALNPSGALPVLQDGDFAVWESNAIMQYLADSAGSQGQALYPTEPKARAKVDQWLSLQMCHFGPATAPFVFENIVKKLVGHSEPDLARLEKVRVDFLKYAAVLERHLGASTFVAGDSVTIADYAIASNLMFAEPAGIPWQQMTHLRAWYARVAALPEWQASEPQRG